MDKETPKITVSPSITPIAPEQKSSPAAGDEHVASAPPQGSGISAELLTVIELAASAFVGRRVSILSIRPVHSQQKSGAGVWASQGRDIQQTSHNLVQRQH